jgi:hypothetical protein
MWILIKQAESAQRLYFGAAKSEVRASHTFSPMVSLHYAFSHGLGLFGRLLISQYSDRSRTHPTRASSDRTRDASTGVERSVVCTRSGVSTSMIMLDDLLGPFHLAFKHQSLELVDG